MILPVNMPESVGTLGDQVGVCTCMLVRAKEKLVCAYERSCACISYIFFLRHDNDLEEIQNFKVSS